MKKLLIAFVLAALWPASAAVAQDTRTAGDDYRTHLFADKHYGMNFLIPTGGKTTAGFLYVLNEDMVVELDFGLALKDDVGSINYYADANGHEYENQETNWSIKFAPGVRKYFRSNGPVEVYYKGSLEISKDKDLDPFVDIYGGLGVEWFVTDLFSISGDTGVLVNLLNHPDNNLGLATVSHGLSANLYW